MYPFAYKYYKRFLFLASVVISSYGGYSQVPSYVPTSGLMAWYALDGSAIDLSGNGNNGIVTGPTPVSNRFGIANSAYNFNGTSDYIYIPPDSILNLTRSVSVSAWVKSRNYSGTREILFRGDARMAYDPYLLYVNGSTVYFQRNISSGTSAVSVGFSTSIIDTSQFHLFTGTYDGVTDTMKIYLDDSLLQAAYRPGIAAYHTDSAHNVIGAVHHGTGQFFSGIIDDVGIWNRALTHCEIMRLYDTSFAGLPHITGLSALCIGVSSVFTASITGGNWVSSNPSIASVDMLTGVVTALASGSVIISYYLGGCTVSTTLTVIDVAPILGGPIVCIGSSPVTLASATSGGWWSSSDASIAAVGSSSGLVAGISPGVAVISYSISYSVSGSCSAIKTITVNNAPMAISGDSLLCAGSTDTFSNITIGGVWSSSDISIASIGSVTGLVSGVSPGVAVIRYTLPSGCFVTKTLTINISPSNIFGTSNICESITAYYVSLPSGGIWASSSPGIAAVGSSTGVVTGIASGTATISYTLATGCLNTFSITVNPIPSSITGTAVLCTGASTTFGTTTTGGTWSSASPAVATVGSSSGTVTGVTGGTVTISYTLPSGCFATKAVTVNVTPVITAPPAICVSVSPPMYVLPGGGIWLSSAPSVASVGSGSGYVTGISAGSTTITYTLSSGCFSTTSITVNPAPLPITGSAVVCLSHTSLLSDATPGGFWTSSDIFFADVGVTTGVVTGMLSGTATITYTLAGSGCYTTLPVTVNPGPTAITGFMSACAGATAPLYNGVAGGTWSSGSPGIATINPATGAYTGVSAGTALISYTIGTGCTVTTTVTINPAPTAIGGALQVCIGGGSTLTSSPGGGAWSSSSTSIAHIGTSTGIVIGGTAGMVTITYIAAGCRTTAGFTVNATPVVTGPSRVCLGSSSTLATTSSGGTWSSSAPLIAPIGSTTGTVSGLSTGTATITYTLPGGCYGIKSITVSPNPSAISGPGTVCPGNTATLTGSPGGGTWSRSNGNITIGSSSGVVTGVSSGTTVVTYTLATGCYLTKTMTVSASAGSISGAGQVCVGATTLLTTASGSGGTWGSSSTAIATVGSGSTGLTMTVNGIASGIVNITYTLGSGCSSVHPMTVNGLPATYPVTGGGNYCAGAGGLHIGLGGSMTGVTYQLFNGTTGGTTLSGTGAALDFGLQTAAGIYTVKATNPAGCTRTMGGSATIGVIPLPVITGPTALCVGATISCVASTPGGSWTSTVPSVATIGVSSGIVSGIATGTTVISYTSPTGCQSSTQVTVSTSPGAISGAANVCVGLSTTLTNTVPGGAWSSSSGVATVGSLSGVVTGVAPGITTITYSLGTGCTVTKTMTVLASPLPITGTGNLCVGGTATLTSLTPSGTWSSSASTTASVSTGGAVSGVAAGTAAISYTVGSCSAILPVTVNTTPGTISGPTQVCIGSTITLTNPVSGGLWSTTATQVTIDGTTGTVNGISSGTALITYAIGACRATRTVSVNGVSAISGATGICVGANTTLTSPGGGAWSSSTPGVATIGATSGTVSGIAPGTTTITYTLGTGCSATTTVTVNTAPGIITGIKSVCVGQTTTLSNTAGGGIWSSGSPLIASAGSTGIITGNGPGTATITYSLGSGCTATAVVTVNTSPGAIGGPVQTCMGSPLTLSNPTPGGTWSATGGTATITPGGVVSGTSAGTATVSYTLSSGCAATKEVTINAAAAAITGTANICVALTTALSNPMGGGTWSSGSTGIATVDASGMVTGVAPGMAAITYTLGSGCAATRTVTVNAAPGAITGSPQLCIGSTITLSNSTPGGTWTSGGTGIATVSGTVGSTGLTMTVSGIAIGTEEISYTVGGCPAVTTVTVNGLPPAVTGPGEVCVGSDITLANATAGGTWSSSNPIVALAGSATGIVSGMNAGTATITYTLGAGCTVWKPVTVNPLPSGIRGSANICLGGTTTLVSPASGGIWSSGATSVAVIGSSSGVVYGLAGGLSVMSYTLPTTGCSAIFGLTVVEVGPTEGITGLCAWGDTMLVHNATTGGSFSSTLATVADLGGGYGIVTGHASGTATVTYTLAGLGCMRVTPITVNPLPGPITGGDRVCPGQTLALGNSMPGGVWGSSDATVAPITTGGALSGLIPGTTLVTYILPTGCSVDTVITVSLPPSAIAGAPQVCAGSTTTYTNTIAGGTWTSSAPLIAMIGAGGSAGLTMTITGVNPGTATITYTIAAGCSVTKTVVVNPLPTVYTVTGGGNYCAGGTGMSIGLSGSQNGTDYQLYLGATTAGSPVTGTGTPVDFGPQTAVGSYTAIATNPLTGCIRAMSGGTVIGTTPSVVPSVTMGSTVGNTVCAGTTGTYTAIPVNGGSAPMYQWYVNGVPVGTGVSYSYTPGNGDVIRVAMTSSAVCATPPVVSAQVTMTVYNWFVPVVTITAQPGTTIKAGQWDTLVANVSGGAAAAYQWYLNGWPVSGANSNTYISNSLSHGDSVSCLVAGQCGGQSAGWVRIYHSSVGVAQVTAAGALHVFPNPNGGEFTIRGEIGNVDGDVVMGLHDVLGRDVYSKITRAANGYLEEQIKLPKQLTDGVYLLTIRVGDGQRSIKLVVAR